MTNPAETLTKVEYRVRPVTRFIVTRYEDDRERGNGLRTVGEYTSAETAWEVGYALAQREHEMYGWPSADMRMIYPRLGDEPIPVTTEPIVEVPGVWAVGSVP